MPIVGQIKKLPYGLLVVSGGGVDFSPIHKGTAPLEEGPLVLVASPLNKGPQDASPLSVSGGEVLHQFQAVGGEEDAVLCSFPESIPVEAVGKLNYYPSGEVGTPRAQSVDGVHYVRELVSGLGQDSLQHMDDLTPEVLLILFLEPTKNEVPAAGIALQEGDTIP